MRNFSNSARAEEYYERGVNLEDNGELEAALEHYERAVSEDPAFGDAYVEMAYIQLRLGDERRAVENLRRAIRVAGHPLAYYNLGWIYEGRDRPERAEMLYRKALEASPEMPDAHLGLGAILLGRGRPEEAAHHIERAAELGAESSYVQFLRESAVPRYREFASELADAAAQGAPLGMKERVYLDLGAVLLGSDGDDGVRLPAEVSRRRFSKPSEMAVTLIRLLGFCEHFKWRFGAVAATDPDSEPLALVLAARMELPYWRPDQVGASSRVLLVSARLSDTREYFPALDALDEVGCSTFVFALALDPSCARNLDYRSLPQAVGLVTRSKPYWLSDGPDGDDADAPDPAERLEVDLQEHWRAEGNMGEQISWYDLKHSHLNFPLRGSGGVRR